MVVIYLRFSGCGGITRERVETLKQGRRPEFYIVWVERSDSKAPAK